MLLNLTVSSDEKTVSGRRSCMRRLSSLQLCEKLCRTLRMRTPKLLVQIVRRSSLRLSSVERLGSHCRQECDVGYDEEAPL